MQQGSPAEPCAPLLDSAQKELATFVREKYRLLPAVKVRIVEHSVVADTCFQKLSFEGHGFSAMLYLSPDARFLTTDLLDTRGDPLAEEGSGTRKRPASCRKAPRPTRARRTHR